MTERRFDNKSLIMTQKFNLREAIILTLNRDIFALVEIHLRNDDIITLPNYTWFGNNRAIVNRKAIKVLVGLDFSFLITYLCLLA